MIRNPFHNSPIGFRAAPGWTALPLQSWIALSSPISPTSSEQRFLNFLIPDWVRNSYPPQTPLKGCFIKETIAICNRGT